MDKKQIQEEQKEEALKKLQIEEKHWELLDKQLLYLKHAITQVIGIKVLICDDITIKVVMNLMETYDFYAHGVYSVFNINETDTPSYPYATAICILSNTQSTLDKMKEELQHPRYKGYYLNFTHFIGETQIETLAEADKYYLVKNIETIFIDKFVHTNNMFTLNFRNGLTEEAMDNLIVHSLGLLCVSLNEYPYIYYGINTTNTPYVIARKVNSMIPQK